MSDDRLERALGDAIADLAGTGSPDYLDDILERTARTRQRPWWTFPGRYTIMAPTLKFAVAATLAFVLGVAVSPLILPSDGGTVPAPASVAEPEAAVDRPMTEPPTHFSGRIKPEPIVSQPTSESRQYEAGGLEWIVQRQTYGNLESIVTSSDERFSGRLSQDAAWDDYWLPDEDAAARRPRVMTDEWRLENDRGSWTGTWHTFSSGNPTGDFDYADAVVVFEGDGDYAGYQAIVHVDYEQISSYEWYHHIDGWIVEGGLPRS